MYSSSRAERAREKLDEARELADESRVNEMRHRIIEEERKKILEAHAKRLGLRHLPKGVLSSKDDIKIFQGCGGEQDGAEQGGGHNDAV